MNEQLHASPALFAFLRGRERFRAKPYLDLGVRGTWTNGYGNTAGVTKTTPPVTEPQAREQMARNVASFEAAIHRLVRVALNQLQYDALCTFVFNVGVPQFETSTLLRLLNKGDCIIFVTGTNFYPMAQNIVVIHEVE